ncbi:type I restriction enzyme, S subunit [Halopseudomonas xinjiangensis]|uniref:Type I restriction enzyme, S subunit n=1 Tax=Halopseudomonas xinjiangensis TaxID=487184 RepID=A0A1H1QGJ2_9GAMM|nr:restriction endonuclease subunit S [Halopseudomonas xinjiangensis]SDS22608.1 type I restriction enzyme, S subunit [Halopseudomonas xinjiangensis]
MTPSLTLRDFGECLLGLGRGQSPTYVEGESPIHAINQKCVRNGIVDAAYSRAHDPLAFVKEFAVLQNGDVCINSTGTGTIGRVGLWAKSPSEVDRFFADSHVTIARPNTAVVNPRYLTALLQSPAVQTAMETYCFSGSTNQVELNKSALSYLTLSLLSRDEQDVVAEVIAGMDRAIEQTEALIAKQQRIKTGLMQDLLTNGIDEYGNIRSEATHAFKDSPLGRIPVEWEVQQLNAVAKQLTSGSRGWARYYSSEGAIFLRIGNLTREHINLRLDDLVFVQVPGLSEGKRTSVCEGDLLISITADLGIIGVIPADFGEAYVNQHIALVRLDRDAVNPRFVGHLLNGFIGRSQIDKLNESGAKAGLNLPTVGKLLIVVPKVDEQERVAELLDATDRQVERDGAYLKKLTRQKAGLTHDLLTGERRVISLFAQSAAQ